MQSIPTVIKTKLPVHNFLLIGKNQSQHKAIATDKAPAKSSFAIPSYVLPFCCTHLPAAYPNVTFAIDGNVLSTPRVQKLPLRHDTYDSVQTAKGQASFLHLSAYCMDHSCLQKPEVLPSI